MQFAWTASPPARHFDDAFAKDPNWTAPNPAVETGYTVTQSVKDSSSQASKDTVKFEVAPQPARAEFILELTASIEDGPRRPRGLVAVVESYGATMFGGQGTSMPNATRTDRSLRWLLCQPWTEQAKKRTPPLRIATASELQGMGASEAQLRSGGIISSKGSTCKHLGNGDIEAHGCDLSDFKAICEQADHSKHKSYKS